MKLLLTITLSLFTILAVQAQVSPVQEAAAQAELQRRGLSEDEVRAKMLQRGIDIDNVRPEQLPSLQPVLEQVLAELEAEKAAQAQQAADQAGQQAAEQSVEAIQETTEQLQDGIEQAVEQQAQEEATQLDQEIQEAVSEGASVQEAISETLVDATQEALPPSGIFGHEIFRNQSIKLYRTTKDVKPPDSYVLGVGDEIGISIFGISQADFAFEINEDGYITPAGLPRMYLKGITYGQAKTLVRNRFAQYYVFSEGQFALSVKTARTITVNIFGEVENYGSFTISAVNTAFNALVAAGGPTNIGSVRNISIIRNGRTVKMDVYQFMVDPTVQYDFFLQNNDIIHVPTADRIVSISGEVKRPMRYELIGKENLLQLIEFAGGLTDRAYTQNVQVKRISGNNTILLDVNLAELQAAGQDFPLLPSDQVSIRAIPGRYERFVALEGAVDFPGQYEITDSMRVSNLLAKGQLQPEARTDIAFLLRSNRDGTAKLQKLNLDSLLANPASDQNVLLQPKDKLVIYTQARYIDRASVSITGSVRNPKEQAYDPDQTITVQDMILLAGGLEPTAAEFGYIKRTDPTDRKMKSYQRVNVFDALANPTDSTANPVLQPYDVLTVYSKERYTESFKVTVGGAVRNGGSYDFDEGLRISDLVYFSGGLKLDAAQYGYISRTDPTNPKVNDYLKVDLYAALEDPNSAANINVEPGDRLTVYTKGRFFDDAEVSVSGAVRDAGVYQYDQDLRVSDVVYLSGGLTKDATDFGYIVRTDSTNQLLREYIRVDVGSAVNSPGSAEDLILAPFDRLNIMGKSTFTDVFNVRVTGAVRQPGTYQYDASLSMRDVLTLAGGLKLEASYSRIDVSRLIITQDQPTRTIVASLQVDNDFNPIGNPNFQLQPYDIIMVRTVPDYDPIETVTINGEVQYPGLYALTTDNEKMRSIVKRAGGLTTESFPEGTTLFRPEENTGFIVTKLKRVMRNRGTRFNYVLKPGDVITIPKSKDLVTINLGNTLASELYPDRMLAGGKITVAKKTGKRAKWYIKKYAAGFSKNAKRKLVTVEHPNGEIRRTRQFLFLHFTPKMRKGSVANIGSKPPPKPDRPDKPERQRGKPVDWDKAIGNALALATSALTIIVLADRL